jgi:hypothetical protein
MKAGQFLLTGDTIKFSREHVLSDGQNRLSACVRAGKRFRSHVVFGGSPEAFAVIDTNTPRTNEDTLRIEGCVYPNLAARAVRWIMIQRGNPEERGRTFDNATLLKYYQTQIDQPRLDRIISNVVKIGKAIPQGSLAGLLYLFEERDRQATEDFIVELIQRKRGGMALIKKIDELRRSTLGRMHETSVNAFIIQAWQPYRNGRRPTKSTFTWTTAKEFPSLG